jgi:hypothetical protein
MQKSPKKQKKRRKSKLSVIERSTQYRVEPSKRTKQVIAAEIQCCGEEHAPAKRTSTADRLPMGSSKEITKEA